MEHISILQKAIETAPSLAIFSVVCIVIVRIFIKSQEKRDEKLSELSANCHAHSKELTERYITAIDKNTIVIEKNLEMLGKVTAKLDAMK